MWRLMKKKEGTVPNQCINLKKYFNHALLGAAIDSIPFIWNRAGAIRWLTCSVYIFVTQHAITYFIALVGLGHLDSIQRHFGGREREGRSTITFPISLLSTICFLLASIVTHAPHQSVTLLSNTHGSKNSIKTQNIRYALCVCVCVLVHIWSHAGCLDPRGSALFLLPL